MQSGAPYQQTVGITGSNMMVTSADIHASLAGCKVLARGGNTTSSLAIIDGYGNALALTTTINTYWDAHIEAGGMMLNNAMSNFSASAIGAHVNGYAVNKRPRSSIAPAIAFDSQRRLRLAWGSAGGGPVPDYIVKTFPGNVVYGKEMQAAINADNWSGQGLPASVAQFESGRPIVNMINTMRSTYGYNSNTLNDTRLVSGRAGIETIWGICLESVKSNSPPQYQRG